MVNMVTRVTRQSLAQLGRFVRAPGGCSALTDYGLWEPFVRWAPHPYPPLLLSHSLTLRPVSDRPPGHRVSATDLTPGLLLLLQVNRKRYIIVKYECMKQIRYLLHTHFSTTKEKEKEINNRQHNIGIYYKKKRKCMSSYVRVGQL